MTIGAGSLEPTARGGNPASGRRVFWYPYLLIGPTMLTLVIVSLIPFLYAVFMSVHEVKYGRVGDFSGLVNYIAVLADPRFWNSMKPCEGSRSAHSRTPRNCRPLPGCPSRGATGSVAAIPRSRWDSFRTRS